MLEKVVVLSVMYSLAFATDVRMLRKSPMHGKTIYFGAVIVSLYYSFDYLVEPELPDLHWLIDRVLTKSARLIVEYLKVKPA